MSSAEGRFPTRDEPNRLKLGRRHGYGRQIKSTAIVPSAWMIFGSPLVNVGLDLSGCSEGGGWRGRGGGRGEKERDESYKQAPVSEL